MGDDALTAEPGEMVLNVHSQATLVYPPTPIEG